MAEEGGGEFVVDGGESGEVGEEGVEEGAREGGYC